MTRMHRDGDQIVVEFDEAEAGVLGSVARQLSVLLADAAALDDPAVTRMMPDAYPDDAEASAEFRRFTREDMASRKAATAAAIADAVGTESVDSEPMTVRLDGAAADRWLRGLADLRITLASRLGIEHDDDEAPDDATGALYHWLGELQWALVETMDTEGTG
ncbi:MAG: DUF2017 family protein [Microbacteriaceae bacterium]